MIVPRADLNYSRRLGTLDYVSPFLFSLKNSSFNVKNIIAKICFKKLNYSKALRNTYGIFVPCTGHTVLNIITAIIDKCKLDLLLASQLVAVNWYSNKSSIFWNSLQRQASRNYVKHNVAVRVEKYHCLFELISRSLTTDVYMYTYKRVKRHQYGVTERDRSSAGK